MSKWLSQFTPRVGAWIGLSLVSAIAGVLVTVMLTPVLVVSGVTLKNTIGVFDDLPDYIAIDKLAEKNEIYAQNDANPDNGYKKIAEVYWQNREEVGSDQVSQYLKDAAVAGEDRRFFEHRGVDIQGLFRAALGNVISGGVESGASTLTMQVVKNIYVQQAEALPTEEERKAAYEAATATSIGRKLKEMKLAISLEKKYDKEAILMSYLNISNFGGNTYGVEAAAQSYFGKSAKDVTAAEAASLIAIVQYPMLRNLSDPANYSANQDRRDKILNDMHDERYLTDAEFNEAIKIPVDENFVHLTTLQNGCIAADEYARWFCDYVVRNVRNFESLGATPDERLANWHVGGYKLYTTMNYALQKVAQDNVWKVPADLTKVKLGSVSVSVEVGTGRVLTMAQNKRFNDTLQGGGVESTAVNFNTDRDYGGSSGFQTGSTYKIFALTAWLQSGRGVNELVDASQFVKDQAKFVDTCVDGGGPWFGPWKFKNNVPAPKTVTVMEAVRRSINSAFVAIGEQLDQCAIRHAAESLGIHRADGKPLHTNPSAILGTNELAPLSLVSAFSAIANAGRFCEPIIIDKVIDPIGIELPGQTPTCRQGIEPDVAYAAIYAMKPVLKSGGALKGNPQDGTPIFGKTGTTNDTVQTWLVTSTSRVTTASWVGVITGPGNTLAIKGGNQIRYTIMKAVMSLANKQYSGASDWPRPAARYLAGGGTTIPEVAGLTVEAATALLKGLGFDVMVGTATESDFDNGLVVASSPAAGTKTATGAMITLTPSIKRAMLIMPDFVTTPYTQRNAERELNRIGATKIRIRCEPATDPNDPKIGYVLSHYPNAGAEFAASTYVRLTILQATCP